MLIHLSPLLNFQGHPVKALITVQVRQHWNLLSRQQVGRGWGLYMEEKERCMSLK